MGFRNLAETLEFLEQTGRLLRVDEPVSVRFEAAALLHLASRDGKAVYLGRPEPGAIPVVGNVLCHDGVLARALGVPPERAADEFLARAQAEPLEPRRLGDAPVLAREIPVADLGDFLPVLTHYEGDSAPFLTTAVVSAFDPANGTVARGVHRMERRGPDRFGVALLNRPLSEVYGRAKAAGTPLPAAVTVGHEPLTFLAAAFKGKPGVDKMAGAGALRGEPVDLVPAPRTGIPVPAEAELLLEGVIDPADERPDGPFGEISGVHVALEATPTFVTERVWCRASPLYHALLPTAWESDRLLAMVWEAAARAAALGAGLPVSGIRALPSTYGSTVVLRVPPAPADTIKRGLRAVLEQTHVKLAVAVAEDIDMADPWDLAWSVASRTQPDRDWSVAPGLRGQPIDPSAHEAARTAKAAIDATGYGRVAGRRVRIPEEAVKKAQELGQRRR